MFASADAESKANMIKKLHEKVRDNLERKAAQTKKYADRGRKQVLFEPGDWVWLHMRSERFPTQRKSKLMPRGDGPFQVLEKINDNAYKLQLPGEMNISATFNVSDLSPFDAGDTILRTESSQEGGNDEDMTLVNVDSPEVNSEEVNSPILRHTPKTRAGVKAAREEFTKGIGKMVTTLNRRESKRRLLFQEVNVGVATAQDKVEKNSTHALSEAHEAHMVFLPLLEGRHLHFHLLTIDHAN